MTNKIESPSPSQWVVRVKFFSTLNKGTVAESRTMSEWIPNGPFSSPENAELFARNVATAKDIAQVVIEPTLP